LNVPVQPVVTGNVITAGSLRITVQTPATPAINVVDMRTVNVPGYGLDFNKGYRIDITGGSQFKVVMEPQ
jgi:hypothetical protein